MSNNTKREWSKPELIDLDASETEHNIGAGHDGFFADSEVLGS